MPFYAVKVGRKPGIYTTWPEAEAQVKGFSGAQHAKFATRNEAYSFIGATPSITTSVVTVRPKTQEEIKQSMIERETETSYQIWTDGSYKEGEGMAYAYVIADEDTIIYEGGGWFDELPHSSNHAELIAVIEALRTFNEMCGPILESFTLFSDSEFVVKTLTEWGPSRKNNKAWEGKSYVPEFKNLLWFLGLWRKKVPARIVHVRGHQGVGYNDYVDQLATEYRTGIR